MCIIRVSESLLVIRTVLKQLPFLICNDSEIHNITAHVASVSHVPELMGKNVVKQSSALDL